MDTCCHNSRRGGRAGSRAIAYGSPMGPDTRQRFRFALLVFGWGMVGVNAASGNYPAALLFGLPMLWLSYLYFKRRRRPGQG